jgi:hypothetical protein
MPRFTTFLGGIDREARQAGDALVQVAGDKVQIPFGLGFCGNALIGTRPLVQLSPAGRLAAGRGYDFTRVRLRLDALDDFPGVFLSHQSAV